MGKPPSIRIGFLGVLAGLIVGALVGMGFDKIPFAAVIGGVIGSIVRFFFPNAAGFILGGLIDL
jgi:hypothetical protein